MRKSFRYLALALSACIALSALSACGKTDKPEAETTAAAETSVTEAYEPESTSLAEETTAAEAETLTEAPTETPAEAETEAATEKAAEAEQTTEKPEDKTPSTKEEIVALFNDSVNRVKANSKAIVSNYTLNSQSSDAVISNKMLQGIANKLISANMGYDKKKANITYSSAGEKRDNFPVRGESWSSHLSAADLSNASITEKDGVYTVTLYLLPDTTPNIKADQGHAGKGFSIITKESIVDGAGSLGMSVIQEDSIKLTFKNCKIVAKIDKATGNLLGVNYYMDWTLALTALGLDVAVSFGAEDDYSVVW